MTVPAPENVDPRVVRAFGEEWHQFDQTALSGCEYLELFDSYFGIFPWDRLPAHAEGFDLGCGSGRWARGVAPRVGKLHCIDPSAAIDVARRTLSEFSNCEFHQAAVSGIPLADGSMDFGYSLGVLHHVPDTAAGLRDCVRKLKPGAPFLLYLYYAFDNKPSWYWWIWRASEVGRFAISRLPRLARVTVSEVLAAVVYWPAARTSRLFERLGVNVNSFPLSFYRDRTFYAMRTDALDRFGTRLEKRFTKVEIESMMREAGLDEIRFSERAPFWCAVGVRR